MRNRFVVLAALVAFLASVRPALAIPIFAQRYMLKCTACHSVLPELNEFGRSFRAHGYRLPIAKHGTTLVAVRYQLEYEANPGANRRWSPGGVLLSNADIGRVAAFVHYNLGAGGGPSALFLGYLATYNERTQTLYRGGLYELPLAQSPGQRLDDLAQYGFYGTHVGLNDLSLASPRWGVQAQRTVGATELDLTASLGAFKGAAYGGRPLATGETTSAAAPEYGLFVRGPLRNGFDIGGEALSGTQQIVVTGHAPFDDGYVRSGLFAHAARGKVDLQAEQWWGTDRNADGFGNQIGSSGGYVRFKYYPTPHAYLGIRYDASANPTIIRDVVYYGAFQVTPHARLVLQQVQTVGGTGNFGGALTVGFPWPRNL